MARRLNVPARYVIAARMSAIVQTIVTPSQGSFASNQKRENAARTERTRKVSAIRNMTESSTGSGFGATAVDKPFQLRHDRKGSARASPAVSRTFESTGWLRKQPTDLFHVGSSRPRRTGGHHGGVPAVAVVTALARADARGCGRASAAARAASALVAPADRAARQAAMPNAVPGSNEPFSPARTTASFSSRRRRSELATQLARGMPAHARQTLCDTKLSVVLSPSPSVLRPQC